jgi:hypothetical protein
MAMCRAWLALPLFVRLHSSFQDVRLPTPTQNHPVDGQKWHPTGPTSSQHDDLLPQHQDLGFQRRAWYRSTTIPKIILQRSNIPQKIIRFCVSRQLDEIYDRDSRPMSGKAVGGVLGLPTATGARM